MAGRGRIRLRPRDSSVTAADPITFSCYSAAARRWTRPPETAAGTLMPAERGTTTLEPTERAETGRDAIAPAEAGEASRAAILPSGCP